MSSAPVKPVGSATVQNHTPRVGDLVRWTPDPHDSQRFALATVVCSNDGQDCAS